MAGWVTVPTGAVVNLDYVTLLRVEQDSRGYIVAAVSAGYAQYVTGYYPSRADAVSAMDDIVLGRV